MSSEIKTKNLENSDTSVIEIVELRPEEVQLIKALRHNWRFGDVTIRMRDGVPFRLVRIQEFMDLST